MRPSADTRVFALLGDPVTHSLSPRLHNAAFQAAGVNAVYVALRCRADDVVPTMRTLASAGGGGNITIPHKGAAAQAAVPGSFEERLGAVNTFTAAPDGLQVANTDVAGIAESVGALGVTATTWLIIGTGGSARAAVGAAVSVGARVAVSSREASRAAAFLAWARSLGAEVGDEADAGVVINATPLGLRDGDALPVDPAALPEVRGALDLTYRLNGSTAWCRRWTEQGTAVLDGREPLLRQGAAAWAHWLPGVTPPLEVMRAVLRGSLE